MGAVENTAETIAIGVSVIPSEVACEAVALCEDWRNLWILAAPRSHQLPRDVSTSLDATSRRTLAFYHQ
jgi:hypothetical protein